MENLAKIAEILAGWGKKFAARRGEAVERGAGGRRHRPARQTPVPGFSPLSRLRFRLLAHNPLLLASAYVRAVQILQENKDKKDAEFNERFKHSKLSTHCTTSHPAKH